jgi:CMP-N,N'-diacetyllegionaminic acid synthase
MNKIFALIPARAGSKGVPNKNIMELNGHPLLGWSIAAAKKSKLIDRVVVSTDSHEYADIAMLYGAEVPFIRPNEISNDSSTDLEFIEHALDFFRSESNEPDYIAHLRPTTPIRDPQLIDKAIESLCNKTNCTSLRSIHEMSETAYKTLEIDSSEYLRPIGLVDSSKIDNNAPRQTFPKTYQANGYIDILISSHIRRNGNIHGDKCLPFLTDQAIEIDCSDDFRYLEYTLLQYSNLNKIFN